MSIPILDFKTKKPTHNESLYQVLEEQGAMMRHLHLINIALMRVLVEKKITTPEIIIEKSYEQMANDNFVVMLNALDQKFVADYNGGLKVEYNQKWYKRLWSFLTGKRSIDIKVTQKQNANTNDEAGQDSAVSGQR